MAKKKESYPQVMSEDAVNERFGSFKYKANGSRFITILGDWVTAHITTVYIPQLAGVLTYGGRFDGNVRFHKDGVLQLQKAFAEIGERGMAKDFIFWGGSFVPRRMAGLDAVSRHSWGIAFDVNVQENWIGETPAPQGAHGSLWRVAPVLEAHGFAWGGRWKNRTDGMHFEIAEEREYRQVTEPKDALLVVDNRWREAIPLVIKGGVSYAPLLAMAALIGDEGAEEERLVPVAQYLISHGRRVHWNAEQRKVYASLPA